MQTDKMTNSQRGRLGERIIEIYINDELIPSLKKSEDWTDIIYTVAWFKATWSQDFQDFNKFEEEKQTRLLLSNGFYPIKEFVNYFNKLVDSLSNIPDGFLIKMKRIGAFRTVEEAIKEYNLTSEITLGDLSNQLLQLPDIDKKLPVVDGKIEVVEVKTGEGVKKLQVPSYRNAVANGYPLRLFKVDIEKCEIKEKLIVNPDEVTCSCFKQMASVGECWSL
jgi:hypothetical protein